MHLKTTLCRAESVEHQREHHHVDLRGLWSVCPLRPCSVWIRPCLVPVFGRCGPRQLPPNVDVGKHHVQSCQRLCCRAHRCAGISAYRCPHVWRHFSCGRQVRLVSQRCEPAAWLLTCSTRACGALVGSAEPAWLQRCRTLRLPCLLHTGHYCSASGVFASTGAFTAAGSNWGFINQGVGVIDVGGGGVIHCVGGAVALTACLLVGPRQDQYVTPTGLVSRRKRNSVALQVRGVFLLWAGFIALNALTASNSIVARPVYVAQVCSAYW